MANGRKWCREELEQVDQMLADGGYLQSLAEKIDRTPEAILIRAHKVLKAASADT
jgi:hypothetical protein